MADIIKPANITQLESWLTSMGNAIRAKGGTSAKFKSPQEMLNAVNAISKGTDISPLTGIIFATQTLSASDEYFAFPIDLDKYSKDRLFITFVHRTQKMCAFFEFKRLPGGAIMRYKQDPIRMVLYDDTQTTRFSSYDGRYSFPAGIYDCILVRGAYA